MSPFSPFQEKESCSPLEPLLRGGIGRTEVEVVNIFKRSDWINKKFVKEGEVAFTNGIPFLFKNVGLEDMSYWTWDLGSFCRPADNMNDLMGLELYQNLGQELLFSSQANLVGIARVCNQLTHCKLYCTCNQRLIGEKYLAGRDKQGSEIDSAVKRG